MRVMALALLDMADKAGDGIGVSDRGNDPEFTAALGTGLDVDPEDAVEPRHPGHRRGGRFAGALALLGAGRRGAAEHNEMTVSGVGSEQSMVSDEMGARSRHEGGKTSDEVVGPTEPRHRATSAPRAARHHARDLHLCDGSARHPDRARPESGHSHRGRPSGCGRRANGDHGAGRTSVTNAVVADARLTRHG